MGINQHTLGVLLRARAAGVDFSRTVTIGRQDISAPPGDIRNVLRAFGYDLSVEEVDRLYRDESGFAEPLFRLLGAKEVMSVDVSDYEKASIVHDMNEPIPDGHKDRFSVVFDGGSLEHVFNFPTAVKNCMEMVRPGGHFLALTPANNLLGHGFYQFSPELFFRVFAASNGFQINRVLLRENLDGAEWFEAIDPDVAGRRVTLTNSIPTSMYVEATKLSSVPIFATLPQQSDYVPKWKATGAIKNSRRRAKLLPPALSRALWRGYWIARGGLSVRFDRGLFRRIGSGPRPPG